MPAHLVKQEEIRKMQREQFYSKQMDRMKKQVGLYRKYRVGELPDIQINYKDILEPLMGIIHNDTTFATEIFVELFSEIYKQLPEKE
jgi:DNA-dependent protein kinase catalytic subunit